MDYFNLYDDFFTQYEETDYTILSEVEVDEFLNFLKDLDEFSFDLETTGLNFITDQIRCIGFGVFDRQAFAIPWSDSLVEKLKPIFESTSILKIAQNASFDIKFLKRVGINVVDPIYDTMVIATIVDEIQPCNLLDLSLKYVLPNFAKPLEVKKDLWVALHSGSTWKDIPIEVLCLYCAEDVSYTLSIKQRLQEIVDLQGLQLCVAIDMQTLPVLIQMEYDGLLVDLSKLVHVRANLLQAKQETAQKLLQLAGFEADEKINFSSSQQIGQILFKQLKLPIISVSERTGVPSTAMSVLEKLKDKHPFVRALIDYRGFDKLISTYANKLPLLLDDQKVVHCSFNLHRAVTGRLSCNSPNLQAIPASSNIIRELFIARPGYVYFIADYSQLELIILAYVTQDPAMVEALQNGVDLHNLTASVMYKIPIERVTKEQRANAKTINFGLIYGMSASGVAANLGCSRSKAQQFLDAYFAKYQGVQSWINKTIALLHQDFEVRTIFDRVRHFDKAVLLGENVQAISRMERQAINFIIQSAASYATKLVMRKIYDYIQAEEVDARLLLQVHDELIIELQANQIETVGKRLEVLMTEPFFEGFNINIALHQQFSPCWIK